MSAESSSVFEIPNTPPSADAALLRSARLIVESYERLLGKPLLAKSGEGDMDLWSALWAAPRVVVAHGTQDDPIFFYGNRMALQRFEMDFAAFTCLPSRYSAEPLLREERARLLERVSRDGYIDDYAGIRMASSGRRFRIEQAVVWNLVDAEGRIHGQAATFDRWASVGLAKALSGGFVIDDHVQEEGEDE